MSFSGIICAFFVRQTGVCRFFLLYLIFAYNFHGTLCTVNRRFFSNLQLIYVSVCNRQLPKFPCIATVSNAADLEMFQTQATAIWEIFFGRNGQINYMRCCTGILQVSIFYITF